MNERVINEKRSGGGWQGRAVSTGGSLPKPVTEERKSIDAVQAPLERPSWDEYFMKIAHEVAQRSTCTRRRIGALIVRDKRILATGYNNVPSGIEHCTTRGCLRDQMGIPSGERHELCRGIHAEQNAVVQAARYGISIEGSMVYCTAQPCILCAKILINAGITEIVFAGDYPDELSRSMIEEAGLILRRFEHTPADKERESEKGALA